MGAVTGDPRIGSELAGYRIEALLGRGGMGVVYRAHDLALDRPVALKILAPELAADVGFRERFLRESRVAASIEHPNVVPVHDAGEVAGELFIAMRYVEGSDLKRLLAQGPLPKERAIALVGQVAAALDAAHARGLVHRDVKPSNVLVADGDHVYLADFGLTRRLGDPGEALGAGQSLGTPDYVAPEQIRGDEVDGRADLYSLGCLLYECLTGEPPFRRESELATLFAQLEEEPPAAPGLDEVMRTALAKDPDSRYQSGGELVEAARSALGLEAKRVRWPLAVAAVGLALIGAALLAFFLTSGSGSGVKAEPGADTLVRIDPATNRVKETMPVGRKTSGIGVGDGYVWVPSFADGNVWRIDPKTHATLKISPQGSPTGIAFSGKTAVVANGPQHSIAVIDGPTGTIDLVSTLPGASAAGVLRVAGGPRTAWFADPTQGDVGEVTEALASGGTTNRVGVAPDRTNFLSAYSSFDALAMGQGAVWILGDTADRVLWRVDPKAGQVTSTARLPFVPGAVAAGDGAVWVTSLLDDTVARIDPVTGRIAATIRVGRGVAAIAAGGGAVWAASSIDGTVSRIDPATNRVVATVKVGPGADAVAVGSDGVWVTTAHEQSGKLPSGVIKIGILSDCLGPYGQTYDVTVAGAELPLIERGGKATATPPADGVDGALIAGRPVRLFFGCADVTGAGGLTQARRLVEHVGVNVLVGPVPAEEELPLQDYARRHPRVAFVNGAASVRLADPAPNFFSFHTEGTQWMAGLGSYAFKTLGWRSAVVVNDEGLGAFSWGQAAGFIAEFCSLGGTIAKRIWIPPGTQDYSDVVSRVPASGVDGLVVLSGDPAVVALANSQPWLRKDLAKRMIVGAPAGPGLGPLGARIKGLVTGSPTSSTVPGAYVAEFRKAYPRFATNFEGGIFDLAYYGAVKATLQALQTVHGDLSDGEKRFMVALGRVALDLPNGRTTLDAEHQAVAPNYLLQFESPLREHVLKTIPAVDRSFNGYLRATDPPPSENTPACVKRTPPPWAR